MRISPIARVLAAALAAVLVSTGGSAEAASLIELTTPNAQATKFSQNGEYLVGSVFGAGGLRWTASTGSEDLVQDMVYVNGINNLGTVSGARSDDGGSANGGHDLPAVSPIGATTSTPLPLPAGIDNVDVYDLADDGTAVGLAWTDDFSVAKAYYYSPVDGVVDLPVDNTTSASRGNVVSADGHVVGGWSDDPVTGFRRGVVWVDRVATYVRDGDGNDLGETDGISGNGQWAVGSGWRMNVQTGEITAIPGMPFAFGVSDDGSMIVGASGFFDNPPRALLIWTEAGGSQILTDYLADRGIAIPGDLTLPLQGGLTAVSGDASKIAGWTYGSSSIVTFVVDGANEPIDKLFADGFDPPPPPPVVQDGSFEETTSDFGPNPYWDGVDGNPNAGGGSNFASGGVPTHDGIYSVWFGGWGGGDQETQTITQTVTMPASGPQYLNYWRYAVAVPDVAGTLTVSVDGTPVETTDLSAIAADTSYVQRSIDIGSYADGAQHVLQFQYDYPGGGAFDGNIFIDDVSIDPTSTPARHAFGRHVEKAVAAKLRKQVKH
ncbi:hypothetical protein [Dokdonella sp.]|uniref:hypothetical protein n=1 Tax=Dokdonella sp. TaxID=2291710 RepID=UPI002F420B50